MRQGQDYGGTQDRGSRDYQEDAFHFQPLPGAYGDTDGVLLTLSDGMGGCNAGGHASTVAVEAFVQTYLAAAEEGREADRLHRALLAANQQMARDARANPDLRGMGCTLIGASLTAAGLQFVSVGDSLVLLCRDGEVKRLNADHSMAPVLQQAVLLGTLSKSEMASHPHRNALRSAVMGRELGLVDLCDEPMPLLPGDRLLVASDGLLTLDEPRILQLLEEHAGKTAEELSTVLVQAVTGANNPHQDNVTVMLAALPVAETVRAATDDALPVAGQTEPKAARTARRSVLHTLLQPRILAGCGAALLIAAAIAASVGTFEPHPPATTPNNAVAGAEAPVPGSTPANRETPAPGPDMAPADGNGGAASDPRGKKANP